MSNRYIIKEITTIIWICRPRKMSRKYKTIVWNCELCFISILSNGYNSAIRIHANLKAISITFNTPSRVIIYYKLSVQPVSIYAII